MNDTSHSPLSLLLTKADVCTRLRISPRGLENLVAKKQIAAGVSMGGKEKYWAPAIIDQFIEHRMALQADWRSAGFMSRGR